jgi:hypothetical protein
MVSYRYPAIGKIALEILAIKLRFVVVKISPTDWPIQLQ